MNCSVVSVDEALRDLSAFDAVLDVRSESEFAEDHLPGAINTPVLNDAERAEVGTLHKRESAFAARRRGAALVARNIAHLLETRFAQMPRDWKPLVYCWRGGQRSGALTLVLERVGWHARQLEGGYRAYRRRVLADLERLPQQFEFRVVCGPTGCGKSRLLQALATAGAQVLDLEALAHHRGSVLGALPSLPQPAQKMYDSRIWWMLRRFDPTRPVFVEAESRKVGNLRVPDALIMAMRAAACIRLELPMAERIALLRDEYAFFERDPAVLMAQLDCLRALHGSERVSQWKALAQRGQWDELVERLLREHYDPAYQRSLTRNFIRASKADVLILRRGQDADFAAAAQRLL
ncbi:MAG: tRNA 2-selenouridine(34) synthase MnmH [Sutterellaceae bacterium]|nr:tRNA 2-selenouridine(34) synthase MnmH [Burkholderiaceae bacterium]MCX7902341.1 tRNA 2-selenouridine(34) synthase MnmH [Burkholderiaceae bacterium]MDW8429506.1 tRNA 2-selenouridine(34) synthase MnmH [Sutterellaceae bacterium]